MPSPRRRANASRASGRGSIDEPDETKHLSLALDDHDRARRRFKRLHRVELRAAQSWRMHAVERPQRPERDALTLYDRDDALALSLLWRRRRVRREPAGRGRRDDGAGERVRRERSTDAAASSTSSRCRQAR
jgi:hypothetical protein